MDFILGSFILVSGIIIGFVFCMFLFLRPYNQKEAGK